MNGCATGPGAPFDVAVLGAGPAGAAAALGLQRLGYSVAILGRARAGAMEGLSARTVAALGAAGLIRAAACGGAPVPRIGAWGGERALRGREFLVDRAHFDRALALDLAAAGLPLLNRSAHAVTRDGDGWLIDTDQGALRSRAVIEARGRRARGVTRLGPRLVSWMARCRVDPGRARGSAVVALEDGWCWMGVGGGLMQRQFVTSPRIRLPPSALEARFEAAARLVPELDLSTRDGAPPGPSRAKAAVMRLARPAPSPGLVRVGDAALALDPLSGQGVYEALGSARIAVAAIRTFLDGGAWAPSARFVDERTAEIWKRGLETAGAFYRLHAGASAAGPFWDSTAAAYERLAASAAAETADPRPGRREIRPVLNGERIEMQPVWVSARWPRGVWRTARPAPDRNRHDDPATTA